MIIFNKMENILILGISVYVIERIISIILGFLAFSVMFYLVTHIFKDD